MEEDKMVKIYSNMEKINTIDLRNKTRNPAAVVMEYPEFQVMHPNALVREVTEIVQRAISHEQSIQIYTNSDIVFNAVRIALLRENVEKGKAQWICVFCNEVEAWGQVIDWDGENFMDSPESILDTEEATLLELRRLKRHRRENKKMDV